MIQKILAKAWALRREFAKYFLVGITGVIFDIGSLVLFKELFDINATVAVIINQFFVFFYIFFMNKYWSFRNKEVPHRQLVRFSMLAAFNYACSVFIMHLGNGRFGFDYRLVRVATIAAMVPWNFCMYKLWVYREPSVMSAPSVNNFEPKG